MIFRSEIGINIKLLETHALVFTKKNGDLYNIENNGKNRQFKLAQRKSIKADYGWQWHFAGPWVECLLVES